MREYKKQEVIDFFVKHDHIFHPQGTYRQLLVTPAPEWNQQQVMRMSSINPETDLCQKYPKY